MENSHQNELLQIRTDMKDMKGKVDEMYNALMGNRITKDGGLVGRIEDLEKSDEKLDGRVSKLEDNHIRLQVYQRIMWTSVGFVAASIFSYILTLIFK